MKSILMLFMRVARKLFRNTRVQQLSLTTAIYKKIAIRAFGTDPVDVNFRGVRFLYPGADYTTLPTLVTGDYEEAELDHLIKTLDSLDDKIVALDVGANVGIWTVLLAKHHNVHKVIAFEPSPSNLSYLRHNIQMNAVEDKVQIVEAAVSDKAGVAYFTNEGNGATMRLTENGSFSVSTVLIDEAVGSEKVGLIKIDVEGFEPAVLDGSWKTIERCFPYLYIEYSLSQTRAAGKSWGAAGTRLLDLYGEITAISDGSHTSLKNFDELENDERLINLFLGFDPKVSARGGT